MNVTNAEELNRSMDSHSAGLTEWYKLAMNERGRAGRTENASRVEGQLLNHKSCGHIPLSGSCLLRSCNFFILWPLTRIWLRIGCKSSTKLKEKQFHNKEEVSCNQNSSRISLETPNEDTLDDCPMTLWVTDWVSECRSGTFPTTDNEAKWILLLRSNEELKALSGTTLDSIL